MSAGFNSPTILFLNTWDAPERAFGLPIFRTLRERHGYTRYVEPMSGAFVMPLVALDAGFTPAQMECSDVSLYSAVNGTLLARNDFGDLGVRVDGLPIAEWWELAHESPWPEEPASIAGAILYTQLLLRMKVKPEVGYWLELCRDLEERRDEHVEAIAKDLRKLDSRLGGMSFYRPWDVYDHLERVADDPHTVISLNPPTYKGGFEKFYETAGRLTWDEPSYEVFDAETGIQRICAQLEGRAALLMIQEQKEPGNHSHPRPIFARHLSLDQYIYFLSNRPEEIFGITGGPKVTPRKGPTIGPIEGTKVLPRDYELTEKTRVDVVPCTADNVAFYKDLWLHRIKALGGGAGGDSLAVVIDGRYVCGVISLSTAPITYALQDSASDALLLRFSIGAPHAKYRLTRLATMLALQRCVIERSLTLKSRWVLEVANRVVTVEYTRHPEAKGLRGVMKLERRKRVPGGGNELLYAAPIGAADEQETLEKFRTGEERWLKSKAR